MFYGPFGPRREKPLMIQIGMHKYRIILLDTNAISYIVKHKDYLLNISNTFPFPEYIFAYSPYTIYELLKNKEVFEKYLDVFSVYPSLLLRNERELFEEIETNTNPKEFMAIYAVNPSLIIGNDNSKNLLRKMFELVELESKSIDISDRFINEYKIMRDWSEWGRTYNPNTKQKWIEKELIDAFSINFTAFFKYNTSCKGDAENYIINPVIQVIAHAWFDKFVTNTKRKTSTNDVVDIYNAVALPFCDGFISERNMNNVVKKLVSKHIIGNIIIENASKYLLHKT